MQTEKIDPRRWSTYGEILRAMPEDRSWIRWTELRERTKDKIKSPNALSNGLKDLEKFFITEKDEKHGYRLKWELNECLYRLATINKFIKESAVWHD